MSPRRYSSLAKVGVAVTALAALSLPACSSGPRPAATAAPSSPTVSGRLYEMIAGEPKPPTAPGQVAAVPGPSDYPCPDVAIRDGAGAIQLMAKGGVGPTDLRHQLSIVYTARECSIGVGLMTIRVGIQGRAVLGPKGVPGPVDAPLRYAVVNESAEPRTVITKFVKAPVEIPHGTGNVPFTHVYDLTFPLPSVADLRSYIVYVGFDPQGR